MTRKSRRVLIAAAGVAAVAGTGAGIAAATGGDDAGERPIAGSALERASRAALSHTGGGRVTATEVGDEEGHYEVEVRRDNGSQVDVHLDGDFHVLDAKADEDGSGGD